MTYLVDWQIHGAVKSGLIQIDPFYPSLIQPASYDLTLSNSFVIMVDDEENLVKRYSVFLRSHEFMLGCTKETITLPRSMSAIINGKSTFGRQGLFIENAGFVDPGFSGQLTLELYNASEHILLLHAGQSIAQIRFCTHANCEKDYSEKGGKYQNQVGATEAR